MKKTILTLLVVSGLAMADTLILTLPGTQAATASTGGKSLSVSVADASGISVLAGCDNGVYMFCNGGQTGVGGDSTEGAWTYDAISQTASVELWGRKNWGGTNVAVKTAGGLTAGTELTSLTLTTTGLTGATDDYALYFGVVNASGDILASGTSNNIGTGGGSITLTDFGADTIVWGNGYSVLLGFVSEAGSSWNSQTFVNGIQGKAETAAPAAPAVPEPTTATLSLLALAGLAARRRRK